MVPGDTGVHVVAVVIALVLTPALGLSSMGRDFDNPAAVLLAVVLYWLLSAGSHRLLAVRGEDGGFGRGAAAVRRGRR